MTVTFKEHLTAETRRKLKAEPKTFSICAPSSQQISEGVMDVSASALLVNEAMREMGESIPNGQLERTQIFLARAQIGLDAIKEQLQANGVNAV